jgi:quinol monooxygenase YgiN
MANFLCIAQFISKPGKEEELYKALLTLLAPTRAEPGCLSYNLHQNVENSSIFTMTECFESKEAFDFHATQPYLHQFRELAKDAIESAHLTLGTKL